MKVRNGFVSNSSTSSFCIFGVQFPETEIHKILKATMKPEHIKKEMEIYDVNNFEDLMEEMPLCEKIDLTGHYENIIESYDEYDQGFYVGILAEKLDTQTPLIEQAHTLCNKEPFCNLNISKENFQFHNEVSAEY